MEERHILTAIETLAAEINILRYTNDTLQKNNDLLTAENAALRAALESRVKVSVEVGGDE